MTSAQPVVRARFWRRFFAALIDACAITAAITAIGIALFSLTDGRIRVGNTLVNSRTCSPGSGVPAGFDLPADFNANYVARCRHYFFGFVHDRTVTVLEVTRSGTVTHTRSITLPADTEGRPTQAFYLDYLGLFIFVIYRIVLEWKFGATLGKDTLYMCVQPVGGGPMTAAAAVKRTLILLIPICPLLVLMVPVVAFTPAIILALGNYFLIMVVASFGLAVALGLNFILALRRGNLPWNDRWAGTEVIRTRVPAAVPPGQPSPARPPDLSAD